MDLYFTESMDFTIQFMHVCDQALTIRGCIFTNCVHNLEISEILIPRKIPPIPYIPQSLSVKLSLSPFF